MPLARAVDTREGSAESVTVRAAAFTVCGSYAAGGEGTTIVWREINTYERNVH